MRTPVRGASGSGPALETVQESSLPSTPAISGGRSGQPGKASANNERPERIEENPMEEAFGNEVPAKHESGNESAGKKSTASKSAEEAKEPKKPAGAANSAKPPAVSTKRSFTQLPFTKASKTAAEGSVKNMTVETETVSSVPQVALGGGPTERNNLGRTETGGSVRLKPSTETIRPKKEKKKAVRKAPSLNAGNGGYLCRRLHHHHTFTRPPSLECLLSLTASPPYSAGGLLSGQDMPQSALLPGNRKDSDKQNPANPPGNHRRHSGSVLIPFRGRTASTKADIFEAKIATAVDEANSSDSEETFVYESNPPEPHSARPHRFHSRTPSATSTASHYEGMKNRQDGHHTVVGKKSMKFANNYNSIGYANDEGTVRGPSHNSRHSGNTTPHHHHHIGRYGRGGHASLFDSDSPFTNPAKSPQSAASHLSRFSPKHSSPRSPHTVHVTKSPRKVEEIMSYDLEGEGADDERTPLIGSGRARNRRRPLPGSVRQIYSDEKSHRFCGRATAWSTLGAVLALIIAAIVAVVVLCSKPLIDVQIKDIRNVLASEQEIMLDLHVHAINPNLIAIQVSDLDVNIFAKSKHVGTNELWRSHRPHDESPDPPPHRPGKVRINSSGPPPFLSDRADIISQLDNVDEGTDPIDDPATDSQTMLLGQIFEFDSPLEFKPSPIHHRSYGSLGEVRLAKPGNRTEEGGSQRWEHVLQHDFELIARGVLRYSLPVSSRLYSAKIAGRIVVHPSEGIDESGNMRVSKPDWPFEPGSNVLLDPPHRGRGRTTVSGPT